MNFLKKIKYYIYKKAHRFIKSYEGYSYDFEKNGEELILKRLNQSQRRELNEKVDLALGIMEAFIKHQY